ncbi:unnamed protein product [marine sediment metagenome]|uniref:YbaK/aminoacyl-tRNA synthetase-associated domain-containing protein n=1 Tax=marine sediment metagenome TaxID=412755 RepID=X1R3X1_9ZZZZ
MEVASFLGVTKDCTLKAVFYMMDGELVFVTIRGDLEVNEVKLRNALKCTDLRLANDEEVRDAGLVAGSASAIGLSGVKVIADDSITLGRNFVVGANKADAHFKNDLMIIYWIYPVAILTTPPPLPSTPPGNQARPPSAPSLPS